MQSLAFKSCSSMLNTSPSWPIRVWEFSELCDSILNCGILWSNMQVHGTLNMLVIFGSKNVKPGNKLKLTYLYTCWIMHLIKAPLAHIKMDPNCDKKSISYEEVWNPVCCYGNKTTTLVSWSTFSKILLQRIRHFRYNLAEISFFIIFVHNKVKCMTSWLGLFVQYLWN